ncbi:hypothetical protein, partial [Pseudomonas syringae group genomosp. 7]|uniref:hypothetical protein n=1 Tax=Pseudomonas syringae group genomosp. 7 TaxID=251699 RepID=UPI0037704DAC
FGLFFGGGGCFGGVVVVLVVWVFLVCGLGFFWGWVCWGWFGWVVVVVLCCSVAVDLVGVFVCVGSGRLDCGFGGGGGWCWVCCCFVGLCCRCWWCCFGLCCCGFGVFWGGFFGVLCVVLCGVW